LESVFKLKLEYHMQNGIIVYLPDDIEGL